MMRNMFHCKQTKATNAGEGSSQHKVVKDGRVKKNWCCKHQEGEEGWSNSGVQTHTHTPKSRREMRMLLLLFSSTAPPQQASPLTSPAEQSAFMFFSKSQVVLPRATLTEPGAKSARGGSVANTWTATHAHRYSGINVPSCYTHPRTVFTHMHTRTHPYPLFDCLNAVAVIKTH